jgi:1,4-alpha-glucan branching enzyme
MKSTTPARQRKKRMTGSTSPASTSKQKTKQVAAEVPVQERQERYKRVLLLPDYFPEPETRKVLFELFSPDASEVFLAGTFNQWQASLTPLRDRGNGRWFVELELKRGRYEYRFLVNGQWMDDPWSLAGVPNPFGGVNAVMQVGTGC